MMMDCAVIGGGPAGLNAALVLARAKRTVMLLDDGKPRNATTRHVHGFVTRDGVDPKQFRLLALQELSRYPAAIHRSLRILAAVPIDRGFRVTASTGRSYAARKLILATGLRERLPDVPGIEAYYGVSLFSCPYCDGWELADQPIAVIADASDAMRLTRLVYQWSRRIIVCTNGTGALKEKEASGLAQMGIKVHAGRIRKLLGTDGKLGAMVLDDGAQVECRGGFVSPQWRMASPLGEMLGCAFNEKGFVRTDDWGRTSVYGVYAAGDMASASPPQAIIAAATGSKAAIGVNSDLIAEDWPIA